MSEQYIVDAADEMIIETYFQRNCPADLKANFAALITKPSAVLAFFKATHEDERSCMYHLRHGNHELVTQRIQEALNCPH